ncbi:MAG: hypothetical protein CVT75_05830 [Alphaproteobacteria bacterium HGW-Alphaproteobacteria-14]|nr:MAG: hypothetical protein CVT75_05830 [Alphaproteobacteria bacterium HGW-Alphaproteobacteria-14]
MNLSPRETAEAQAQRRYIIMNVARVGGIALLLLGVAITRDVLPVKLPWTLGAGLAVLGLLEFFFLPPIIAKRWKAGDNKRR